LQMCFRRAASTAAKGEELVSETAKLAGAVDVEVVACAKSLGIRDSSVRRVPC